MSERTPSNPKRPISKKETKVGEGGKTGEFM